MIAEIGKSNSVKAVVEYNEKKVAQGVARVIYDNTMAVNGKGRIEAMYDSLSLNGKIKIEAFHTPISFNPSERELTDSQMVDIARKYAEQMGYGNTPMVIYRHLDTNHQHLHITCPTVDFDGIKINDSKDFKRSMEVSRQLEKKYDLLATDYLFTEHDKFNEIQREMHIVLDAVKVEMFENYNDFQHLNLEDYQAFLMLVNLAQGISKERASEEDIESKNIEKQIKGAGVTTTEYLKVKKSFSEVGFNKVLSLLETKGHKVKTKKQLLIEELDKCRDASINLKTYEEELINRGIEFRRIGSGAANYTYCNREGTLWVKQKQLPPRFSVSAIRNRDIVPVKKRRNLKISKALVTNLRQVLNISLSTTDFKLKLRQLNIGIKEVDERGMKEYTYSLNQYKSFSCSGSLIEGFDYNTIQNHFNNPNKLLLRERVALNESSVNDRKYVGSIGSGDYLPPKKIENFDLKKQKQYVVNSINKARNQSSTYEEFKDTLMHKNRIELIEHSNTRGIYGISFKNCGVANPEIFKGSQLGQGNRYDLLVSFFALKKKVKTIRIMSHFSDQFSSNVDLGSRLPLAPFKMNVTGVIVKSTLKSIMASNNTYQNEQELKRLKQKYENEEKKKEKGIGF
ncbi:relaxase/mobilization nuclease domain-containing protein [Fulvivirga sp.]|uniref:relaxase/mobilization nuclease domain-containing protein n=1 Tax=Fulvivirga sp. TaxID=1931237 RepID=UPI0032F0756F